MLKDDDRRAETRAYMSLSRRPRAGAWARRESRRRQRTVLRSHPFALTALLLTGPCIGLIEQLLWHGWTGGALFGGAAVASAASVAYIVMHVSGSPNITMGANAEEWTAQELRKYERRGARTFDNISFFDGDVDHVLIGNGVVLSIETKWTRDGWDLRARSDRHIALAVCKARMRARRLTSLIRSSNIGENVDAIPVLMLWGGCNCGPRVVDGVCVLDGNDFSKWFAATIGTTDPQQLERVVAGLDEFVRGQRAHERRSAAARKAG